MKRYYYIISILILLSGAYSTSQAEEKLVIAGTGDSQDVLRQLATVFEETHPGTHIVVPDSSGSGGGIKELIKGTAGLARTARALKVKEQGHGIIETVFAFSPVVFVTNANSKKVNNIASENVAKIYNGTITNWSELGGEDHKLYPVNREVGDSSRKVINSYLTAISSGTKTLGDGGKTFFTTQETAEAIAKNPYTIGFLPLPVAKTMPLQILSLDSVYPSPANVQSKSYPLITTFYLMAPANPSRLATAFIDFIQEETAQQVMQSMSIIPFKKTSM